MQIALVTYADYPALHAGDASLVAPLERRGAVVSAIPWQSNVDWQAFDAVVIRSTWDYHHRLPAFRDWLDNCAAAGVRLFNVPALVSWNIDKRYLLALSEAGIRTLPTVIIDGLDALETELAGRDWSRVVVKPTISASGDNTWQTTPERAADDYRARRASLPDVALMMQPYAPQIVEGEWSLVFIEGLYSHAVLKVPAAGVMFVHEERGGTTRAAEPPGEFIADASVALRAAEDLAGAHSLYARVDGVATADGLLLMEIECIEPELFFQHAPPAAAERFAGAIIRRAID